MYKYRHIITQEIIEIIDFIVNDPEIYFDSPYIESWWHIDDDTNKIDNYSETYSSSDNGIFK